MFEHLTFTLAQQDGAPPPPPSDAAPTTAAPGVSANNAPVTGQDAASSTANNAVTISNQSQPIGPTTKPASKPFGDPLMIAALVVLAFMFFFTINSSRKEKKKRATLATSLKKGAKVRTIGGIVGTVVEIREDNTIVLKVDENANTRIKFDRSAVAAVLEDKAD